MGILRRIRDISMATLNDRLEKAEDPVKLIDQFLWSTRDDIIQAERLQQQYVAHTNQLKAQWLQAEQQIEQKEKQAMIALKAGEENIARSLLTEKTMILETANNYRNLYQQSNDALLELEAQLKELRTEYQLVYDKRAYYVARMESIRLQRRLNERMSFNSGQQPGEMMRKMETRIQDMELETQSLRQVRQANSLYGEAINNNTRSAEVDLELQQLKDKLNKEGWSL